MKKKIIWEQSNKESYLIQACIYEYVTSLKLFNVINLKTNIFKFTLY